MKWLEWTNTSWRRRAFVLLTVLLILCIASNPELASFVPVLDALGLDLLVYLFAAQLGMLIGDLLVPLARLVYRRWVHGAVLCLYYALIFCIGGYMKHLIWHARHVGVASTVLGPNSSFKPMPLRGTA